MTPEYGAASQLEKIDMLDFADLIALNKFDKEELDALRDVKNNTDTIIIFGTLTTKIFLFMEQ